MAKITFKPRNGSDLFLFMERSIIDTKLAMLWAIEEFVTIDDKPLDVVAISNLSDRAYLMISSKIFPMNDPRIIEDNEGVKFENYLVKTKKLHRDFITQLQTKVSKNNDQIKLLKECLIIFYDCSMNDIEKMPFQLVAFLVEKINFFLSELTVITDEFELTDIWIDDTGNTTARELDTVVSTNS